MPGAYEDAVASMTQVFREIYSERISAILADGPILRTTFESSIFSIDPERYRIFKSPIDNRYELVTTSLP